MMTLRKLVAWVSCSLFCSLHIIAPTWLVVYLILVALCYRGEHIVGLWDVAVAWWHRHVVAMPEFAALEAVKELIVCHPPNAGGYLCRFCATVNLQAFGAVAFGAVVVSLLWPSREWPRFVRAFQAWYEIFDFRLKIDESLFPAGKQQQHIFIAVPHGIIPIGAFLALSHFKCFMKHLNARGAVASVLFRIPVIRQFFLWFGCCSVNKTDIDATLKRDNQSLCLLPGGIAELFLSNRHRETIYLMNRRGFIRVALEHNVPIVPIYIFGHTRLFDQLAGGDGLAARISRNLQSSLTLFWGRWGLPIPFATRLTVVVGAPISRPAGLTGRALEHEYHSRVVAAIRELYAANADDAGYGGVPLKVV